MRTRIMMGVWVVLLLTAPLLLNVAAGAPPVSRIVKAQRSAAGGDQSISLEGEALVGSAKATEGNVAVQPMAAFGAAWSGGSQLYWVPTRVEARLTLTASVPAAGTYSIAGHFTKAPDYGNFQLLVNGTNTGMTFSGYAARVAHSGQVVLGRADLKAGTNELAFQITGKDRLAKGYMVGIDRLELTLQSPAARSAKPPVAAVEGAEAVPPPTAAVVADLPAVQKPARAVMTENFTSVRVEPAKFKKALHKPTELPNADLRPIILQKHFALRDQGARGTCSVHAMTFLLEYMYATRKNLNFGDLSEEYLNYAANLVTGKMADGDFFSNLDLGYQKYGTYPEGLVPYKATFDPKYVVPQAYLDIGKKWYKFQPDFIKPWNSSTGATMGDLYKVMVYLEKNTPVALGMWWPTPGNFKTEQIKGLDVLVVPKQRKVDCADGHSVAIVGYRKDPAFPGGGYFIFRNSYGKGWGDEGYGYIPFDYLLKYANDLVAYRE